jgi:1-pyrroline-4-hydroxy-2-carboxylate deaminase
VDLEGTQRHLEALIESGISGIIMLGSLGENVTLYRDEKKRLMAATKEVARGRLPVLSGVAELSTGAAVEYLKDLEDWGMDGAMLMPSMAFRPDAEEVLAHYRTAARSTKLPIIVYNNPLSYHADVTPELFEQLSTEENLVALKESSGDIRRITDLINKLGNRYVLFAGVDDLALEAAFLGADGWIAGIGLAFPKENQALWDLAKSGKWDEARALYRWYTPLLHLDVGLKFVQNIKLAIQEVGLGSEHVRLPRLPLTGAERERVLAVIREGLSKRPALA